jgi:hypothetical protein
MNEQLDRFLVITPSNYRSKKKLLQRTRIDDDDKTEE